MSVFLYQCIIACLRRRVHIHLLEAGAGRDMGGSGGDVLSLEHDLLFSFIRHSTLSY